MRTFLRRVSCAAALVLTTLALNVSAAGKINVLLITGDDVEPAHNWRETSAATRDILTASGKFEVKVVEDGTALEAADALAKFDVVYYMMYNAKKPSLTDAAKANLLSFVKGGKGFVVTHLASASFKEWAEFKQLCGRYWVMGQSGHGPRGVFRAKVVDPNHPITKGVQDFDQDDELYAKLQGDAPIHVLLETDSDWSKKIEPLAFTLSYGQGRVFHHTFGHDGKALHQPMVEKLILQGTAWAAGR